MTEQQTENLGLPDLPRAIALLILAGISGFVIWSYHNADWPAFIASLVIGSFLGIMAGGLVGVHLFPSLAAMVGFGGVFEGIIQGWSHYGLGGAILGGLVGIGAASALVGLPVMLIHGVMIICGLDPFSNCATSKKKHDAPS